VSVDVEALKILAAEKKLPLERLISAIENEVAAAYAALPEHKPHGRAVLNRETGELLIYVPVLGPDGDRIDTVTDNPDGFAKLADKTARKIIKEKMREAKDLEVVTEFSGSVGDVISGVVQQGRDA
jgi:N utilization substance protein A